MSRSRKSKFPLAELVKSLAPITWTGRFMLAGVVVWFVNWVFVEGETLFGSRGLKTVVDVASALAFIPLAYFFIRGARWVAGVTSTSRTRSAMRSATRKFSNTVAVVARVR